MPAGRSSPERLFIVYLQRQVSVFSEVKSVRMQEFFSDISQAERVCQGVLKRFGSFGAAWLIFRASLFIVVSGLSERRTERRNRSPESFRDEAFDPDSSGQRSN